MRFVDQDDFAAHVAAHLGSTTLDLTRACDVVLGAFTRWLPMPDRELLLGELPSRLAARLAVAQPSIAVPLEEQLVATGLTLGQSREVIASVGHVLGEHVSDDVLARLQHGLPPAIAAFVVRPEPELPGPSARAARRYETLSEGRPGSHAPLSEAHPDRTHQESVANPNPHADAKLSSTTGTTQEREHEDLAEGHPAIHPIATSRG